MPCKLCDHTLQRVNEGKNPVVFWCPRCGSLSPEIPDMIQQEFPSLIYRASMLCEAAAAISKQTDSALVAELFRRRRDVLECIEKREGV